MSRAWDVRRTFACKEEEDVQQWSKKTEAFFAGVVKESEICSTMIRTFIKEEANRMVSCQRKEASDMIHRQGTFEKHLDSRHGRCYSMSRLSPKKKHTQLKRFKYAAKLFYQDSVTTSKHKFKNKSTLNSEFSNTVRVYLETV